MKVEERISETLNHAPHKPGASKHQVKFLFTIYLTIILINIKQNVLFDIFDDKRLCDDILFQ